MNRNLISTGKVAQRLGLSTRTIEKWSSDPRSDFPKPVLINGRFRFDEREVDRYIENKIAARDREQAAIRETLRFQRAG